MFVTFDIEVVDPAFAPGTGTPEVGGFTRGEAIELVPGLEVTAFVGFDLVEVLPDKDPAEITALRAANIAYEFLSSWRKHLFRKILRRHDCILINRALKPRTRGEKS